MGVILLRLFVLGSIGGRTALDPASARSRLWIGVGCGASRWRNLDCRVSFVNV